MASGSVTTTLNDVNLELQLSPLPRAAQPSRSEAPANPSGSPSSRELSHARTLSISNFDITEATTNVTSAVPNGGKGWKVVTCCAVLNFFMSGFAGSWGVLQTALLSSTLEHVDPSTTSWVGSLELGMTVALGLFAVRLLPAIGYRKTVLLGQALCSFGIFASGFATRSVGGLFGTSGVCVGLGVSFIFTVTNTIPGQYFDGSSGVGKLGLAHGIVKAGGGVGATVLSVALEALNRKVGIAWTFRLYGIMSFIVGMPAAWMITERKRVRNKAFVELRVFRNLSYTAVFIAGAICVFALYVPPFFLPLFAQSIGLSSKQGAAIVSGFSLCTTLGRFGAGPLADKIGSVNTLLLMMAINAVSMLAIWPVSSSLPPLVIFAILNGIANGGFFTAFFTVVTGLVDPDVAAVALGMAASGWTFGYLMGSPIAGYILQASRTAHTDGVTLYRPAIFYAGGVASLASLFLVFARVNISKSSIKRI